jgi:hypothetical protein
MVNDPKTNARYFNLNDLEEDENILYMIAPSKVKSIKENETGL